MESLIELKEVHREMVRLELEGYNRKEISEKVGMDRTVVGKLLNHDELVDEYRQEQIKERERELKRIRKSAELKLLGKVDELVQQLHNIAFGAKEDSTKLSATVKALQAAGIKFDGTEEKMVKAPVIQIRRVKEETVDDGVRKPQEEVGD